MDKATFEALCKEQYSIEKRLMETKGAEYTLENQDVLANFKQNGAELGVDPLLVWGIYMNKHISSIKHYLKNRSVKSTESIDSRFTDARNYLLLGLALIKEGESNG